MVEPLPILCFLIEHPEGRFLVDTGDPWRNSVPGYLPGWNPFYKQVQIRVAPHEEVGARLLAMGLDPATDIDTVILTHSIMTIPAGSIASPAAVSWGRARTTPSRSVSAA